jgi:hypothetical protein
LRRARLLLLEEREELRLRSIRGQHQRECADHTAQRSGFMSHAPHPSYVGLGLGAAE